jgi:lysophospholipase L1-like esterase
MKNISLAVSVVTISLIILEFSLRLLGFSNMRNKQLLDFVPRRAKPPYQTSVTLGWDLLPNWEGEIKTTKVSTNSFGMRDDEFPLEKPDGNIRILVIGDSFTFGLGVDQSTCYSEQLEQILNRQESEFIYSVLNGGVGGYNTEQEMKWLKEKGLAFEPDVVIVGFVLNDVIYRGIYNAELQPWPIQLLWRTATYNVLSNIITSSRVESDVFKRSVETTKKLTEDSRKIDELWLECFDHIEEMKYLTDQSDIPLVIVLFPWPNQLQTDTGDPIPQARLIQHLQKLGIYYIDLLPAYQRVKNGLYQQGDNHPSVKGHEVAALEISAFLNEVFFSRHSASTN